MYKIGFMVNNNIIIELKGNLSRFSDKSLNKKVLKINSDTKFKVLDILKETNIPKEYIALITINGSVSSLNSELKDGDKIILYPPVGGG
jgi:molybdopterin converting factor small subunit